MESEAPTAGPASVGGGMKSLMLPFEGWSGHQSTSEEKSLTFDRSFKPTVLRPIPFHVLEGPTTVSPYAHTKNPVADTSREASLATRHGMLCCSPFVNSARDMHSVERLEAGGRTEISHHVA